jgi:alpha-glucosidase
MYRIISFLIIVLSMLVACTSGSNQPHSPDGTLLMKLYLDGGKSLKYTISKGDQVLVKPSGFELEFKGQAPFGAALDMELISTKHVDESWNPLWGKTDLIRNHYNEYVYQIREISAMGRKIEWVIRVYDDGVAFRYRILENSGFDKFVLTEEQTSISLDPSYKVWVVSYENYYTHQEGTFEQKLAGDLDPGELLGCPLLVEVDANHWILVSEADLTNWAGMYFTAAESGSGALVTDLASLKRNPEVKVEGKTPCESPWRMFIIGEDPGDLIESNLMANLNDPVEYEDVSWIQPGISAWDRWWSGDYGPDAGFELKMNTATMKYFVDLAHEMEWEYMIVDWTWYGTVFTEEDGANIPNPDVDITKPIDEVDIEEIIRYANEKDVEVILWVLSAHLDKQLDEGLEQFARWGAAGVKIDFMANDDQDMVNWYQQVARKAAKHQLVVDYHGAYKPTGVSRTLPNILTREGVLGNEYNKWSDQITPRHTVTLPYTRGLLGEMDFTPGGFNHIHENDFQVVGASAPNPYVMGTRCHQLAMTVVYESVFGVMCDSPYNYKNQPGSEFLRMVPTTWNETRYLSGYPGESIVMARRSGSQWYVGGMTNEDSREIELSLDFLKSGNYRAKIWKDASDSDQNPAHLDVDYLEVSAGDIIKLEMNKAGGFVLVLSE